MVESSDLPKLFFLCKSVDPPYQSRCKVGAKSVGNKSFTEFAPSLVRKHIGARAESQGQKMGFTLEYLGTREALFLLDCYFDIQYIPSCR